MRGGGEAFVHFLDCDVISSSENNSDHYTIIGHIAIVAYRVVRARVRSCVPVRVVFVLIFVSAIVFLVGIRIVFVFVSCLYLYSSRVWRGFSTVAAAMLRSP